MVLLAAVSSTSTSNNSSTLNTKTTPNRRRPPLLPSETDNNYHNAHRSKAREVTSRYLSTSLTTPTSYRNSKPCASPVTSHPAMMTLIQSSPSIGHSQATERRRPVTPSKAEKKLIDSETKTKTTRSLSVSFQGESFPFQVSKAKKKPSPSPSPSSPSGIGTRRGTPQRKKSATPKRKDQPENCRPVVAEQHRWPGRFRKNPLPEGATEDRMRVIGSSGVNPDVIRELQKSILSSIDIAPEKPTEGLICSDAESVSSGGSTPEGSGYNAGGGGRSGVRGMVVPARFWQETNGRLRHQQVQPGPPGSRIGLKGPPKKLGVESPGSSPRGVVTGRGQLCPIRGGFLKPASPSKLGVAGSPTALSTSGGSPLRVRNGVVGMVGGVMNDSNTNNMPSILCFVGDIRRGKISENRIVEVHLLRILYNRLLQWRFVNARADSALSIQRSGAEKSLYNAHITTSKLRDSVRAKRSVLLQLRQNLKLISILKRQMLYLDELELIEQDYSRSLSGAIEALRASTLRLPVVCGAKADVQNVKVAISSAVDVLQAMASSTGLLLAKVAEANSLVSELANVIKKEGALLNHCADLLSSLSSMKVKEYSQRTHILQLKRAPMELKTEA